MDHITLKLTRESYTAYLC